eukprot:8662027-Pyramimonas_sp.AAC.1
MAVIPDKMATGAQGMAEGYFGGLFGKVMPVTATGMTYGGTSEEPAAVIPEHVAVVPDADAVAVADGPQVGLDTDVKPLLSHSATEEFGSPRRGKALETRAVW